MDHKLSLPEDSDHTFLWSPVVLGIKGQQQLTAGIAEHFFQLLCWTRRKYAR